MLDQTQLDDIARRDCEMRGLPVESAYAEAIDLGGILGVALSGDPETEMDASRAIGEAFETYRESITTARIARAFAGIVRGYLGPAIVAEINRRNRADGWPEGACALHDVCDGNILMEAAFRLIMHRAPQPDSRADADMWSSAWDKAKRLGFPVP